MDGLAVTFRALEARYFRKGEVIRADEPVDGFREPEDRLLADHPRMRRIVVRVLPTWPLARFCLHWSDGSDLAALDARVAAGTATEADFAGAVVGEALGMRHQPCGAYLRVVALDPVLPLFSDSLARSRVHAFQSACPVCGERLSAAVLEFVGVGEP
ncbi:hypothetical protein [Actinacidiphila yeochonensis]|uniref:hypothetical protein n=1 Tax=Actinacidiphila yeochonensis TaxID=89050 RepID=UPI000B14C001|nr:hypothetical protein [Actinacidiphila yeochonensis]